ncbi:MAG: hypothetical protein NVSMB29_20160 [Candidatus Dormibacteria bacterium]
MVADPSSTTPGTARRPAWALPVLVIAVVAVAVALVVGLRGLVADPVRSVAGGVATIEGSFEPYPCAADDEHCAQGFVQAGSRGVFVRFPPGCPLPAREEHVLLQGRRAPDLGKAAYRATGCAGK